MLVLIKEKAEGLAAQAVICIRLTFRLLIDISDVIESSQTLSS